MKAVRPPRPARRVASRTASLSRNIYRRKHDGQTQ